MLELELWTVPFDFFYRTYLNGQKLALSVVVVLLQLLLNTYTINAHYQGFEKICKN